MKVRLSPEPIRSSTIEIRLYGWIGNPKPINRISPHRIISSYWETVRYASEHEFKNYITMSAAGNERLHQYYAARFNPELKIRYVATKKSLLARNI